MNAQQAADELGINRARWEVQAMAKALGLHSYLNTLEEERRLLAAHWALHHWRAYCQECNARRDLRQHGRRA